VVFLPFEPIPVNLKNSSDRPVVICFTHWTRKGYAVLRSLSLVVKIGVLSLAYSLVNSLPDLNAQTDTSLNRTRVYELEEIAVVGRGSNVVNSGISRMVTVIQRDEIEQAAIGSIWDLLEFVSNMDVRQRGAMGIQSDISIRGSSFDHVMVLLNGINLSDPQTGHLNLDLAVDKEAIERIEIL
jgi:vitamin B12 transporter